MPEKTIKLYFLRWYFPYNVGDSVMLSCLFRAIKDVYAPCRLEVITDETVIDTFRGDPDVDTFRLPRRVEKALPKRFYRKGRKSSILGGSMRFVIWPEWREETFAYLAGEGRLDDLVEAPRKNIISINYALQIGPEIAGYPDLRPRIYLTPEEKAGARKKVADNSIAINMARIRNSQARADGEGLRYRLESWRKFVEEVKRHDPALTVYEVGQEEFHGVGDAFLPNSTIRESAAVLDAMKLVVLSDGGVHNICNAIDKDVLLFQGYEWNPPELFKMGNAIFNPACHPECRKRCHLYSDILGIESAGKDCSRECYDLDPAALARDCIAFLEGSGGGGRP